jgi:hypothetical protein
MADEIEHFLPDASLYNFFNAVNSSTAATSKRTAADGTAGRSARPRSVAMNAVPHTAHHNRKRPAVPERLIHVKLAANNE